MLTTTAHPLGNRVLQKLFKVFFFVVLGVLSSYGVVFGLLLGYESSVILTQIVQMFVQVPSFAGFLQAWVWLFAFYGAIAGGSIYLYYKHFQKQLLPIVNDQWVGLMKGSLRVLLGECLFFIGVFPLLFIGQWILGMGQVSGIWVFGVGLLFTGFVYFGALLLLFVNARIKTYEVPLYFWFILSLNGGFFYWILQ